MFVQKKRKKMQQQKCLVCINVKKGMPYQNMYKLTTHLQQGMF